MQNKLITLRYAANCSKCGKRLKAGERAYWRKGSKPFCTSHGSSSESSQAPAAPAGNLPPVKVKKTSRNLQIDFSDLRDVYENASSGKFSDFKLPNNQNLIAKHSEKWQNGGWYGATTPDVIRWLKNGFAVEGLRNVNPEFSQDRDRRRIRYTEEGELQLDLLLSGFDYPFQEWEPRQATPGLRLDIELVFNANISEKTIAEYAHFVGQAVYSFEDLGYDLEINLVMPIQDSVRGWGRSDFNIRVKRENARTNFTDWSALFSPGGFRHLGFTTIIALGDRENANVDSSLGSARPSGWGVTFDAENRVLRICNADQAGFPRLQMEDQLRDIVNNQL